MSEFDRSTIEHMLHIGNRMETLRDALFNCEEQLIHRLGVEFRAGEVSMEQAADIVYEIRHLLAPGWTKRCDEIFGPGIRKLMSRRTQVAANLDRYGENEPWGWRGECSIEWVKHPDGLTSEKFISWPRPMRGVSVVYLLHSIEGVALYVGSTQNFSDRLKAHLVDGKPAAFWSAYKCSTRESAYEIEDRLLKEHMPTMNKRRGR